MPIRQEKLEKLEKLGRRESRLGLRNIFGRSRSGREAHGFNYELSTSHSADVRSISGDSVRTSMSQPSDSLPKNYSWKPIPETIEEQEAERAGREPELVLAKKKPALRRPETQPKEGPSSWSLPPLFKAFPQAVRYATLPATSLSADAILRINEKKSDEEAKAAVGIDDQLEGITDKPKKKGRRSQSSSTPELDWTRKIYVLVTSGYLLQYSGEGTYDRLPEKVLKLGPASAAFATDAISGRHWVVQISSATGIGEANGGETRSLFSKISFRFTERRNAANLLMVFEKAENMEDWIGALRKEIESHGGKKKQSETGRSTLEGPSKLYLREHMSQRTLVVRDPARFTTPRATTSHSMLSPRGELQLNGSPARAFSSATSRSHSLDDISTTDSIVSQDERQLDSLRENPNRLSLVSSGQRTFVTSTGSSPESSPTNEKFDEGISDHQASPRSEVKMRPNASDIVNRRESIQVTNPFMEDGSLTISKIRALSNSVSVDCADASTSPGGLRPPPNFSVPRASNRRFSSMRALGSHGDISPGQMRDSVVSPRRLSRMAPLAMQSARRLSVITDQHVTSPTAAGPSPSSPTSSMTPSSDARGRRWQPPARDCATKRCSDADLPELPAIPQDAAASWRPSPRKIASTSALREKSLSPPPKSAARAKRPHIASMLASNFQVTPEERRAHRTSFLDVDDSETPNTVGGRVTGSPRMSKRASIGSTVSQRSSRSYDKHGSTVSSNTSSDSSATITSSSNPSSGHYMGGERTPKVPLINRRSMPQIAVSGPPPAPPPTRALPPIPQRIQAKNF